MPARRVSDLTIVVGAGVAILLLGTVAAVVAPPADAVDAGTSTYSAGPRGTKGAYLTLRELGYHAERSVEPMTAVHSDPASTTMILSGGEAPSEQDRRAIREFLEKGGTLVAIGWNGAYALGLTTPAGAPRPPLLEEVGTHSRLTPSAVSAGAGEISMAAEGPQPAFPAAYVPLYGPSAVGAVVAVASVGRGRAVWLAHATPLSNAYLDKVDNLRLLLNMVGPPEGRRVLFDEHYQGYKRSLWSYVAGTSLPWVGVQAGLVLVTVLLTHSRRQGPVRPAHVDARTSPMEFVEMLGTLYGRARARQAAVDAARTRLRRVIANTCGVPVASDDERLARAAAARLHGDPAPIADLLTEADRAAADPDLDKDRAMALTSRLQALSARLQDIRGRT